MGFWTRLKNLFSSNVNAVLDAAEDPGLALDQLIREMDVEARSQRSFLAEAVVNLRKLEKDHERHAQAARDYEQKARVILSDGDESNDYLAKEALLRKRENDGLAAQYKAAAAKQREGVETLQRNMDKMAAKIADAKSKRSILQARSHIAKTQATVAKATAATSSGNAFAELKRLEERINDDATRAEVEAELTKGSVDDQLEEISFGSEVDLELEAMKTQIALESGAPVKQLPGK